MKTSKLLRGRNCLLDTAYPYKGIAVVVIFLWVFLPTIYTLKLSFVEQEEAQYVQALHDILYHGFNLEQYAHFSNADVAPFSFLGPLYLATLTYPALLLNRLAIIDKSEVIIFAMAVTGRLAQCVTKKFGAAFSLWYFLIMLSQFQIVLSFTRLGPHSFGLLYAIIVMCCVLERKYDKAMAAALFSAFAFRLESIIFHALLLGPCLLAKPSAERKELVKRSLKNLLIPVAFTLLIDSFFWQRTIWPEGCVWLNYPLYSTDKTSSVHHFLWYFCSALPRCTQASFCFLFSFGSESRTIFALHLAAISYVAYLSLVPLKSVWTILYTLPAFNLVAAWNSSTWNYRLCRYNVAKQLHLLFNVLSTVMLFQTSMDGTLGGYAVKKFHSLHQLQNATDWSIRVLLDEHVWTHGYSQFLDTNPVWRYETTKQADLLLFQKQWYHYVIVTDQTDAINKARLYEESHDIIKIYRFPETTVCNTLPLLCTPKKHPQISVLKKK